MNRKLRFRLKPRIYYLGLNKFPYFETRCVYLSEKTAFVEIKKTIDKGINYLYNETVAIDSYCNF